MTEGATDGPQAGPHWLGLAGATLLVLGLTSTITQLIARELLASGQTLEADQNRWSTGGLVALASAVYMAVRCRSWHDFTTRIGFFVVATTAVALVAVYLVAPKSPSTRPDTSAPAVQKTKYDLDQHACESEGRKYAGPHWGCLEWSEMSLYESDANWQFSQLPTGGRVYYMISDLDSVFADLAPPNTWFFHFVLDPDTSCPTRLRATLSPRRGGQPVSVTSRATDAKGTRSDLRFEMPGPARQVVLTDLECY